MREEKKNRALRHSERMIKESKSKNYLNENSKFCMKFGTDWHVSLIHTHNGIPVDRCPQTYCPLNKDAATPK